MITKNPIYRQIANGKFAPDRLARSQGLLTDHRSTLDHVVPVQLTKRNASITAPSNTNQQTFWTYIVPAQRRARIVSAIVLAFCSVANPGAGAFHTGMIRVQRRDSFADVRPGITGLANTEVFPIVSASMDDKVLFNSDTQHFDGEFDLFEGDLVSAFVYQHASGAIGGGVEFVISMSGFEFDLRK